MKLKTIIIYYFDKKNGPWINNHQKDYFKYVFIVTAVNHEYYLKYLFLF